MDRKNVLDIGTTQGSSSALCAHTVISICIWFTIMDLSSRLKIKMTQLMGHRHDCLHLHPNGAASMRVGSRLWVIPSYVCAPNGDQSHSDDYWYIPGFRSFYPNLTFIIWRNSINCKWVFASFKAKAATSSYHR